MTKCWCGQWVLEGWKYYYEEDGTTIHHCKIVDKHYKAIEKYQKVMEERKGNRNSSQD